MSKLFEPYMIRDTLIRNRFIRSATTSAYAEENGEVNDPIIRVYERLSKGEVGLISNDSHIPMLKKLTDAVHKHEGHIVAQLNHAGVVHRQDRAGPSVYSEGDWTAREMSTDEIEAIIEAFGDAAERALQAGFDGVQIHGAHGYLISQFLSRIANKRTDKWGGSLENRMRLLHEIYDEIRGRTGNAPVLIKLNCDDFSLDGFTVDDAVKVSKALSEWGIDLIEISGGGRGEKKEYEARAKHTDYPELAFAGHAIKIREAITPTPMSLVKGFTKLETMERAVENGVTDLISMSRPFIREPSLIKSLKSGQREATCIRCDACREDFGKAIMYCKLE